MQLSLLGREPVTFLCLNCLKCVEFWPVDELQPTLTSSGHWDTNISLQVPVIYLYDPLKTLDET